MGHCKPAQRQPIYQLCEVFNILRHLAPAGQRYTSSMKYTEPQPVSHGWQVQCQSSNMPCYRLSATMLPVAYRVIPCSCCMMATKPSADPVTCIELGWCLSTFAAPQQLQLTHCAMPISMCCHHLHQQRSDWEALSQKSCCLLACDTANIETFAVSQAVSCMPVSSCSMQQSTHSVEA